MTIELKDEFIGTGEVKGFLFKKIASTEYGFIYEVSSDNVIHYEIFERKLIPICIDFENRIYSETDFKVMYPKSKDFGVWAFTRGTLKHANEKLKELEFINKLK